MIQSLYDTEFVFNLNFNFWENILLRLDICVWSIKVNLNWVSPVGLLRHRKWTLQQLWDVIVVTNDPVLVMGSVLVVWTW